jgi:hypothetical protein
MKEMSDDELQQWFEDEPANAAKRIPGHDAETYQALFETLRQEPEKGLPYDFSAKVVRSVKADLKRRNDFEWSLLALIVFGVAAAAIYALLAVFNPKALPWLMGYKWALLAIPSLFITIQWLDQRLVKGGLFRL